MGAVTAAIADWVAIVGGPIAAYAAWRYLPVYLALRRQRAMAEMRRAARLRNQQERTRKASLRLQRLQARRLRKMPPVPADDYRPPSRWDFYTTRIHDFYHAR